MLKRNPSFNPRPFNPGLFNHELSNPGLFNPRLFNHELFNRTRRWENSPCVVEGWAVGANMAHFFMSLSILRSCFLARCDNMQVGRDISPHSTFGLNFSWSSGPQPRPGPGPVRPVGIPRPPPWKSHGPTRGP